MDEYENLNYEILSFQWELKEIMKNKMQNKETKSWRKWLKYCWFLGHIKLLNQYLYVSQNTWMTFVLRCSELWRTCPLNRVWRHMTRSGSVRSLNSGHTQGSGPRSMWHQQTRYMEWGLKYKPKHVNGFILWIIWLAHSKIVKRRKNKKYDSLQAKY